MTLVSNQPVDAAAAAAAGDRRPPPRRGGFSFIEVLFAVMILGIGFILIAGVFPVAIAQTASTREETVSASLVQGAVQAVASIPKLSDVSVLPNDGAVHRLADDQYKAVKGNLILPDDPRYAFVPLLKRNREDYRGQPPSTAQLILVPVQVRGRSSFDARVDTSVSPPNEYDLHQDNSGTNAAGNLMAWPVKVELKEGMNEADTVTLSPAAGALANAGIDAAAPGAVLVIAQANAVDRNSQPMAGRIYRLGNGSGTQYELLPGNDMAITNGRTEESAGGSPVDAWIIGQGLASPGKNAPLRFEGGSMAVGAYTTYIPLK
jgi:type II secretory pathway pseudopilin PulG